MLTRTTLIVAGLLVLAVAASAQNPGPGRGRGRFGPPAADVAAPGGARFLPDGPSVRAFDPGGDPGIRWGAPPQTAPWLEKQNGDLYVPKGRTVALAGAKRTWQIEETAAAGDWALDADEIARVEACMTGDA